MDGGFDGLVEGDEGRPIGLPCRDDFRTGHGSQGTAHPGEATYAASPWPVLVVRSRGRRS